MDTALPYGLRDTAVTPYTDASCTTLATGMDYPTARTLSFSEAEDYEELRGDDKLVALRGKGPGVDWSMEHGGISLPVYKAMAGGTLTTTGITPATVTKYRKKVTDQRPYFKAEGQSINDNGGDFHAVLYRCRASDNLEGEMADGAFWLTAAGGKTLPSLITGDTDVLYDFIINESEVAIDLS